MTDVLHLRYRPQDWEQVYGQPGAVAVLSKAITEQTAHSFLLSGPSGCGKTSLARIAAHELGCDGKLMEIDAATVTGIDAMREIQRGLAYQPLLADDGQDNRAVIIDEAHGLSRAAWDSLLKSVEEPPAHVFWFFCTTQPDKVPKTIQTRCLHVKVKLVDDEMLAALYDGIVEAESLEIHPDIGRMIVREAHGSPRQLLVNIAACAGIADKKTAAAALDTALESDPSRALCRFLAEGGGSWPKAMALLEALAGENPEGLRILIMRYMAAAAQKQATIDKAGHFLHIMQEFERPYVDAEGNAPLLLSIGRLLSG